MCDQSNTWSCMISSVIQIQYHLIGVLAHENILNTDDRCITQLSKTSIDPAMAVVATITL